MSITNCERAEAPVAYPPAPAGRTFYVIGDIHGRRDLLDRVLKAIDADKARAITNAQLLAIARAEADQEPAHSSAARDYHSALSEHDCAPPAHGVSPPPRSFIGPDLTVSGQIAAKGDVRIDGHVCGDVSAGRIVVGEGARIEGSLVAKEVVIGGSIKGTVRGDNLTLGPTACVTADVLHKSLVIEKGCQFDGRSRRLDDRLKASDALSQSTVPLEIYLGDYIDRGEDSRGVVDALIERGEQVEAVFVRGNHEQFLLDFLAGTLDLSIWRQLGGIATMQSYGVRTGQRYFLTSRSALRQVLEEALPEKHARFFARTVSYFVAGPYAFVHAGLRPGIPLVQQQPADLMSIRQQFLGHDGDFGHIVVHGHTPAPYPEFKHNRINLDTGAYSTGRLTCLKIGPVGPELLEV